MCIAFVTLASFFPGSLHAAKPDRIAGDYIALARQGDLRQAADLFSQLEREPGSQLDHYLAGQFRTRFVVQEEHIDTHHDNPFINLIIDTYRSYWKQSLLGQTPPDESEAWLKNQVRHALIQHGYKSALTDSSDVLMVLDSALTAENYFFDRTISAPWHDLVIWKTQTEQLMTIQLPDGTETISTVFMDDFVSLGWSDYATLGMTSSGGWAKNDAIYCVTWAWNHDSENFRVSLLQHEGQHIYDLKRFPKLNAIDLEYRAKLTELVFADTTLSVLLNKFTRNSALNVSSPHAYANFMVTRNLFSALYEKEFEESANPWMYANTEAVNLAARDLLDQHSTALFLDDSSSTNGIFPVGR